MYLVQAIHPTIPGTKMSLYVNKPRAEAYAKDCVELIGDDIVSTMKRTDPLFEESTTAEWNIAKLNDWTAALLWLREIASDQEFDVWIESIDVADRIPVIGPDDKIELTPMPRDAILAGSDGPSVSNYFADYDKLVASNTRALMETIAPRNIEVQPLDPADVLIRDLMAECGSLVEQIEQMKGMFDDEDGAIAEALDSAEETIEAGQAWLDKARPIGKIADDVVRLAGIIVAGTDLHASLSEAMDQHIYDEHDEREPDCHYQAVLDAWTAALAGITVTTFAPPRSA